jgi:hypothetical protein
MAYASMPCTYILALQSAYNVLLGNVTTRNAEYQSKFVTILDLLNQTIIGGFAGHRNHTR